MELFEIISELQNTHCCQCKIGKALIALKGLDQAELDQTVSGRIKPDRTVTQRNTATLQSKTAKPDTNGHKRTSKAAKVRKPGRARLGQPGETRDKILNYLAAHPGLKTKEIAQALDLPLTTVSFHMSQLNKRGLAVNEHRTWRYLGKQEPAPDPAGELDDDEDELVCKLCHSPSASKERLQRHMQLVHGKVV
jgi:DNA-binding NarL/FixJ family response regulator